MDYSSANTSLWNIIIQFGILAATILLSNFLRRKVPFIKKSLMPTAVIGGFLLLIMRWTGLFGFDMQFMEILIYHGIALGFIAMSLRIPAQNTEEKGSLIGLKSGAIIVGSYLVQAITGISISLALALTLQPGLFKAAGILLPMGFGQGPGQANNVGATYEAAGFIGGRSFGLSLAAAGYLCACVIGIITLKRLSVQGKIQKACTDNLSGAGIVETFADEGEIPVSESIDKFSIQMALVMLVYLGTYFVTLGITTLLTDYFPDVAAMLNMLFWGFNFITGSALAILTRVILKHLKIAKVMTRQYQNNYLLSRISGLFFDAMIVAGIASIDIGDLSGLWLPFLLLTIAGGTVTWFYLVWVCRRVYKSYFYQGLLSMYGMMTGTISSGVLLLREIDPDFETPAANNLISGSGFAIIFGAPLLVFIGMACKSGMMTVITLGLCVVYFSLLMLFLFKISK